MLLLLVLQKQLLLGNVVSVTAAKVPTSKFSLSSNSKKMPRCEIPVLSVEKL